MKKSKIKLIAAFIIFLMLISITLELFAGDTRIVISNIEATSSDNIDEIPVYGSEIIDPLFKVEGEQPVQINVWGWQRKIDDTWYNWHSDKHWGPIGNNYTDFFIAGLWRLTGVVYIENTSMDDTSGDTYRLAEQITLTIDGKEWNVSESTIGDGYSYAYITSEEYNITEPSELKFYNSEEYNIAASCIGEPIYSFSAKMTVEGGKKPYTFSKTSGPSWINVSDDGIVSGTPTTAGDNDNLVVRVTDSIGEYKEISVKVAKTYDPKNRETISKVEASSNIDSLIFCNREIYEIPTFQILAGNPAYFYYGEWEIKDENGNWVPYYEKYINNFIPGTWRFTSTIYIDNDLEFTDGTPGYTHKFAENLSVIVNGKAWKTDKVEIEETYSYVNVYSPEYVLEEGKLPYTDVGETTWYFDSVKYVSEKGYITGYNRETFAPFANLTREQLVNILWRIDGKPDASALTNNFSDVPDGQWYTDAIKWASENHIVNGYGGTTKFGLGDNIIRQDLAIMLTNYAKYKEKYEDPTGTLDNFADKDTVSSYAVDAVKWASENGIISGNANGDGTKTIAPLNNAMRCEAAVMLMRFCENILE